jgi:dephospho-CoA kinase
MKPSATNDMTPLKLGVTGGVGSGKSAVCNYLAQKGLTVISADDLARRAVLTGTAAYQNIVNHFGISVVSENGDLDRKKLRTMITRNPDNKKKLESFVHPEVFRLMGEEFQAASQRRDPMVVVEVPLLFELGLKPFFDFTLTVSADREIRIHRMMQRDQASQSDAESLVGIQMPEEEKIRQSDFVIDNSGDMDKLNEAMGEFYQKLVARIHKRINKEVDNTKNI